MRAIWAIAKKDLKNYFLTPIGYLVLTVFAGLMSWMFCAALFDFLKRAQAMQMYGGGMPEMNVNAMVIQPILGNMAVIFLLMGSLITMRLVAEEKKMRTMELLLTSPIKPYELILGKYISALILFAAMLAVTAIHPILMGIFGGNPDLSQILAGYLGVFLLGASFLSLGLFISAMTENQITAGAVTFGLFLFFWIISWISGPADSPGAKMMQYISIIDHLSNFIRGLIDTQDVVYYVSFTFFGLFLTHQAIEFQRWR